MAFGETRAGPKWKCGCLRPRQHQTGEKEPANPDFLTEGSRFTSDAGADDPRIGMGSGSPHGGFALGDDANGRTAGDTGGRNATVCDAADIHVSGWEYLTGTVMRWPKGCPLVRWSVSWYRRTFDDLLKHGSLPLSFLSRWRPRWHFDPEYRLDGATFVCEGWLVPVDVVDDDFHLLPSKEKGKCRNCLEERIRWTALKRVRDFRWLTMVALLPHFYLGVSQWIQEGVRGLSHLRTGSALP